MIMPNPCQKKDTQRTFIKILNAARTSWDEVIYYDAHKTAKGLVFPREDTPYRADLSFDEDRNRLYVELRYRPSLSSEKIRCLLLHIQDNLSDYLASITYEEEDDFIRIRSKTLLPIDEDPSPVVIALFTDLLTLLNDERFQQLLQ